MRSNKFLTLFVAFVMLPSMVFAAITDYFLMTANYAMTSDYGTRDVGGKASTCHAGVDVRSKAGSGVPFSMFPMNSGTAKVYNSSCPAGSGDLSDRCGGGLGNYLSVTSDCGLFRTVYAHADSIDIADGAKVDAGKTKIATYNTAKGTGTTSGLHTHFETQVKVAGVWRKVDPQLIELMIGTEGKNPCNSGFADEALNRSRSIAGKECMRAKDTSKLGDAGIGEAASIGAAVTPITTASTGAVAAFTPGVSTIPDSGATGYDPGEGTCDPAIMNSGGFMQQAGMVMALLENAAKNYIVPSLINQLACPDLTRDQSNSNLGLLSATVFSLDPAFDTFMSGIMDALGPMITTLTSLTNFVASTGLVPIGGGLTSTLSNLNGFMAVGQCAERNKSIINSVANQNMQFGGPVIQNLLRPAATP